MKQILMLIGQNLLRQIISPAISEGAPSMLEPVKEYIEDSVKHYAVATGVAFIFSLYFVAGTLIMITAAAESFDAFGFFAPGTFFYSGVAITVISAAALGGCYAYLKHGRKAKLGQDHFHAREHHHEHFPTVVHHAEPAFPQMPNVNFVHIAEAVVAGLISGFITRRTSHSEADSLRDRIRRVI